MIQIDIKKTEIRVTGHAEFGPPGLDIVCAAVSTLFQNLVWSIGELTSEKIEYRFEKGDSFLNHSGNPSVAASVLLASFFIGIAAIQESYPEFVRVAWVDEDNGNGLGPAGHGLGQKGLKI